MGEDLIIEIAAKLIDAINNISKQESILNVWAPPIAVIIASIITSYAMLRQANKTYQGMVEQTNKTYQGMVEQASKTYQGMVEQTSRTIEHSDYLSLVKKKEELYIYTDIIKKEIFYKLNIIWHAHFKKRELSDTLILISNEQDKSQNTLETINKINMVISIYLQELHKDRRSLNRVHDKFNKIYDIAISRIALEEDIFTEREYRNFLKYTRICNKRIDRMQFNAVNITRE